MDGARLSLTADGRVASIEPASGGSGFLMPSFVDAHCHFTGMGLRSLHPDLSGVGSRQELLDVLSRAAAGREGIVRAHSFDESRWRDRELPDRRDLDRACGSAPVLVRRVCGHLGIASSALLEMLPAELEFVDRETGVLTESAVLGFEELFPPTMEEYEKALRFASGEASSRGVTACFSMEGGPGLRALLKLGPDLEGVVRLNLGVPWKHFGLALECAERLAGEAGWDPEWIRVSGIKFFLDGSIGARTAAIAGCYTGTASSGELLWDGDDLERALLEVEGSGLVPVLHAIGERALEQLLERSAG
ncbi:amidohydrolase family protein, partial [Candidatus Fermentibacterales bacterium]|nr:amidohydrolase family protein [Candidatus Fermentibacterales bacterium]